MVIGKASFFRCHAHGRASRVTCLTVILMALLGVVAFSPVDTWRDWTGASKNDPDPETTPNTQNLAAGEASDYPNLATVPPPPERALTQAEREKLTQSLIADRTNAKYSDEKLRAGFPAVSAPAPPPPPPVPEATDAGQAKTAADASPSAPPAAAPSPASGETPAATASSSGPDSRTASDKANPAPEQGLRKSGEPPEPPPMETSLEVPKVRSVPHPEQVQSAPPPPYPAPAPTAANTPTAAPHLQSPPAPPPMPEAIGS